MIVNCTLLKHAFFQKALWAFFLKYANRVLTSQIRSAILELGLSPSGFELVTWCSTKDTFQNSFPYLTERNQNWSISNCTKNCCQNIIFEHHVSNSNSGKEGSKCKIVDFFRNFSKWFLWLYFFATLFNSFWKVATFLGEKCY